MAALSAAINKEEETLLYIMHPFEQWYASAMITAIRKNEANK
jgi:hypothetical protein